MPRTDTLVITSKERELLDVGIICRLADCAHKLMDPRAKSDPQYKQYWERQKEEAEAMHSRLRRSWKEEVERVA